MVVEKPDPPIVPQARRLAVAPLWRLETSVVVVRLFYQWPTFVTGLGFNLSNLSNGTILLSATAAFKNEPY